FYLSIQLFQKECAGKGDRLVYRSAAPARRAVPARTMKQRPAFHTHVIKRFHVPPSTSRRRKSDDAAPPWFQLIAHSHEPAGETATSNRNFARQSTCFQYL